MEDISLTDSSLLTIEMEESGEDPLDPIINNSEEVKSTNKTELEINLNSGRN